MTQNTVSTLGRLLKSALKPLTKTSAQDAFATRVEPTLAAEPDPAFSARCARRLDEALTSSSRIR